MSDERDNTIGGAGDTSMTRTYVNVIIVEAVIIVLLWILGKVYS